MAHTSMDSQTFREEWLTADRGMMETTHRLAAFGVQQKLVEGFAKLTNKLVFYQLHFNST